MVAPDPDDLCSTAHPKLDRVSRGCRESVEVTPLVSRSIDGSVWPLALYYSLLVIFGTSFRLFPKKVFTRRPFATVSQSRSRSPLAYGRCVTVRPSRLQIFGFTSAASTVPGQCTHVNFATI